MKFEPREPIACSAARTTDENLLKASSSGGMFTELARQVFEDGGRVVGAGWNRKTMCAEHKCASNEAELSELRGSKVTSIRFRDKRREWRNSTFVVGRDVNWRGVCACETDARAFCPAGSRLPHLAEADVGAT